MSRKHDAIQRGQLVQRDGGLAPYRPAGQPPRYGGSAVTADDQILEVRSLLFTLLRRRWEVLLVACLVLVPVAIATYRAERLYMSSALVQVDPEPVQVLPYREIDTSRSGQNYETFMKSQEQLLRGSTLVNRIARRVRAEPSDSGIHEELGRLSGNLSIQRLQETQLFVLSYVSPSPEVAARIANLYAEEFIKLHFETRQATREKAKQLLERELEGLEQRVQASEKQLVTYAQGHSIPASERGVSLVEEKLSAISSQLSAAEGELFVARARVESLGKATVGQFPEKLVTPVIGGLMAKLVQLENDLTVLRATFGENWPAVVQKRTEIALAREQLTREKASALSQAREQAALDRDAAENRRRLAAAALAEQKELAEQFETASIQYNIVRREVDTNRKMFEGMLERLSQTSVTAGMEFQGFHVVEPATPSYRVYSPKTMWNLLLASLLGLALGVCVAFAREYWDTSIVTLEQVEELTMLPVLGAVPHVSAQLPAPTILARMSALQARWHPRALLGPGRKHHTGGGERAEAALTRPQESAGWTGEAAEAVRNVCASILLSRSGRPPRVLMVTSSVGGEGKSTLVREIGESLADSGARTLIIECDMRRPRLGRLFGVGSEGGLSLYLAGHVGPTPTVHATTHKNLFVITAGLPAPNPPALLNSDKMRSLLAAMSSAFRFVILDAPPVLPIADARVLAPASEGVVLVVRAGMASKQLVRRVCSILDGTGANIIGAVLNDADPQRVGGADYRYYRHYYEA